MKTLNFLFKRKITQFKDLSKERIISDIKQEIYRNKANFQNFYIDKNSMNSLLENVLIKVINRRCSDLSLTTSYIKSEGSFRIKLFGENNYFYENARWADLVIKGKLNEELKIKEDLQFSESHLFLIFMEYFDFFEINRKEGNICDLIISLIKKSEIIRIKDLNNIMNEIFMKREDKKINSMI